jgi:hypothetical protein
MAMAEAAENPLKVWVSNAAWFWAARNELALARPCSPIARVKSRFI